MAFLLLICLEVTWDKPALSVQWVNTLGPQDAAASDADRQGRRLIQQRKEIYRRAREAAERDGKAYYESQGLPGQPLPAGRYELYIDEDGDISYRAVEPAGVPIPRPDPANRTVKKSLTVEDCWT